MAGWTYAKKCSENNHQKGNESMSTGRLCKLLAIICKKQCRSLPTKESMQQQSLGVEATVYRTQLLALTFIQAGTLSNDSLSVCRMAHIVALGYPFIASASFEAVSWPRCMSRVQLSTMRYNCSAVSREPKGEGGGGGRAELHAQQDIDEGIPRSRPVPPRKLASSRGSKSEREASSHFRQSLNEQTLQLAL